METDLSLPVLTLKPGPHRQPTARLQPCHVLKPRHTGAQCVVFVKHAPLSRLHSGQQQPLRDEGTTQHRHARYIKRSRKQKNIYLRLPALGHG